MSKARQTIDPQENTRGMVTIDTNLVLTQTPSEKEMSDSTAKLLMENERLRKQVEQLSELNARLDVKLFTLRNGVSALVKKIEDEKIERKVKSEK